MRRCLAFLLCALWAAAATGQDTVSLRWSWELQPAGSCAATGSTLHCRVQEGSPATIFLSVSVTPARMVHLAPLDLPRGWSAASASSGWGMATASYSFIPPVGSAGQRVEIVYRAATDGLAPVDLRIALDIEAASPCCVLPPGPTAATPTTNARLYWDANRPLGWDDFWAPPPPDRDPSAAAGIAIALEYKLTAAVERVGTTWRARIESLTVTAAMERDRSWALPDRRTAAGLNHEQRHFDLAEAYRRLLEALLRPLVGTGTTAAEAQENLRAQAEATFRQVRDRHASAQARYDRETSHGRDATRQAEWDKLIASWLRDARPPLP